MTAHAPTRLQARRVPTRTLALAATLAAALLQASPGAALTDEEVWRSFRFNQITPGARSVGRGGAFIGLADDATALWANPAGLGYLTRPQLLAEIRGTDYDPVESFPEGVFPLAGVDAFASGQTLHEDQDEISPSFFGYVQPINDYFVMAFGRHERMNVDRESSTGFTSTAFPTFEGSMPGVALQALSTDSELDLLVDTFSVSFASAPIEELSLGLTVSMARLDIVATNNNFTYRVLDANSNGIPDTFLRPIDYKTVIDDDDTVVTWVAGLMYRPVPKFGIGLVYRDGPEFEVVQTVRQEGDGAKDLREYLATRGIGNSAGEFLTSFNVPDSYGLGLAFGPYGEWRGGGGITITADVTQVEYSDVMDDFVAGLNNQLFASDSATAVFEVEDEVEAALGVDFSWTVGYNNMIHVRLGAYTEADHSILGTGRATTVPSPGGGTVAAGQFFPRDDDQTLHVTAGAGFTVKRGFYSFSLDGAADFSDFGEEYRGSANFKF